MPDVFISYSFRDKELARWLHDQLISFNIETFLAEVSIRGGAEWKPEVLESLKQSDFVLFLATPHSCESDAVKHEIGGALVLRKDLVPIMAGVRADQLPKWVQDRQAVDIGDKPRLREVFERIAAAVTSKRFIAGVVVGVLAAGALYLAFRKAGS